jgi:hypothetical protein
MGPSANSRQRLGRAKGRFESPDIEILVSDESEIEPEVEHKGRSFKREPSVQFLGGGGVPKRVRSGGKSTPIVVEGDKDTPIDVDENIDLT